LRHFLPTDPELYEGIILGTYTPDQRQGTPGVVT
jgi:hypothetical protein